MITHVQKNIPPIPELYQLPIGPQLVVGLFEHPPHPCQNFN